MMKIDIHTHVLPGIDDGAEDWDTCLEMLRRSAECGVKAVIATPHYLPWKQRTSPREIEELCSKAEKKLLEKHGITMDIYCGNEIYYTTDAIHNLRERKMLTLAGSRYILVEFGTQTSYQVVRRAVSEFREAGYIPIIAHIERCDCLRHPEKLQQIKEMGALLQMNVEALKGGLFNSRSRWAKKRLVQEQIDFLASDMHDLSKRTPMVEKELQRVLKKVKPEYKKELLYGNAQRIIDGIGV